MGKGEEIMKSEEMRKGEGMKCERMRKGEGMRKDEGSR